MDNLGGKIKKIRDLKGITQESIADKLNITSQAYSKIERNETKMDVERFAQIARILDISVEDIQNFNEKQVFQNIQNQKSDPANGVFNYNDLDKMVTLLEKIIEHQKEEIQFLRAQFSKLLEIKI